MAASVERTSHVHVLPAPHIACMYCLLHMLHACTACSTCCTHVLPAPHVACMYCLLHTLHACTACSTRCMHVLPAPHVACHTLIACTCTHGGVALHKLGLPHVECFLALGSELQPVEPDSLALTLLFPGSQYIAVAVVQCTHPHATPFMSTRFYLLSDMSDISPPKPRLATYYTSNLKSNDLKCTY